MSTSSVGYGPFEKPIKLKPTEYGGHEGLVQYGPDGPGVGERIHQFTESERLGMANRSDNEGIDPVTGEPVPEAD